MHRNFLKGVPGRDLGKWDSISCVSVNHEYLFCDIYDSVLFYVRDFSTILKLGPGACRILGIKHLDHQNWEELILDSHFK